MEENWSRFFFLLSEGVPLPPLSLSPHLLSSLVDLWCYYYKRQRTTAELLQLYTTNYANVTFTITNQLEAKVPARQHIVTSRA